MRLSASFYDITLYDMTSLSKGTASVYSLRHDSLLYLQKQTLSYHSINHKKTSRFFVNSYENLEVFSITDISQILDITYRLNKLLKNPLFC